MTAITKGCTVYKDLSPDNREYGQPFAVRMVRRSMQSDWRGGKRETTHVFLVGEDHAAYGTLIHADDLTPEQVTAFAAAREARVEAKRIEWEAANAAQAHERSVLEAFADKLRAAPVPLAPVAFTERIPIWGGRGVGTTLRRWVQSGRGYDTTVTQRDDWTGVEIETSSDRDPVTGKRVYSYVIRISGNDRTPQVAAILAESIALALAIIPTLPDPTPDYDR